MVLDLKYCISNTVVIIHCFAISKSTTNNTSGCENKYDVLTQRKKDEIDRPDMNTTYLNVIHRYLFDIRVKLMYRRSQLCCISDQFFHSSHNLWIYLTIRKGRTISINVTRNHNTTKIEHQTIHK